MRKILVVPAVGLIAALLSGGPAVSRDASGWTDLLGRDLKDWTRLGEGKNSWRMTADRNLISGAAHDAYAPDQEFGDGTLKFEYRFRSTGEKTGYKASVSVRKIVGGTGCKITLGDNCGAIAASFQGSSDRVLEVESKPGIPLGKPAGEWNAVQIQLKARSGTVTINGQPAGSFERCDTTHGIIMFEAEGSEVEFRQIHWRDAK